MRNILKKSLFLLTFISFGVGICLAQTGTYSTRVISTDGTTSTWTFILPSSQVTIPANTETEDNDIIYAPSGSSQMKFSSSSQFSWKGQSSGYIPVPAGGAGTISMTVKGGSDSRYLQLYINGTAAADTKRLYAKASSDGNVTSDGKRGPQSFTFTASDLTTKGSKTYLHFKDNNTEMKIATFTVTLTTGSYSGSGSAVSVDGVTVTPATLELEAGNTSTLTAAVTPDNASNKKVTWSSKDPAIASVSDAGVVTGESAGTTKIIATTVDGGKTAECTVTVKAAEPIHVKDITLDDQTVQVGSSTSITITYTPNNANEGKQCTWTSSDNSIATVNNGTVTGVKAGTVTITATSTTDSNIKATCKVTVTAADPLPQTGLSVHEPDIYEEKSVAGGYNGTLTISNGREYEVYYTQRTDDGDYPTFAVNRAPEAKTTGISGSTSKIKNVGRDGDLWFEGTITEHSECKKASSEDEFVFETKTIREHRLSSSDKYQFHIKGFDQFSLWGMDKKLDPKNGDQVFVVKVDGKEQTTTYNADKYSIRRYNITTGEHVIEISTTAATKTNKCAFGGFSLRVSDQPRVRWLKGNDSTQTVLQTQAPKAVYYFTKYSAKGETKLVWDGPEATGITLEKAASSTIGDTLVLGGVAKCPVGEYKYNVVTYMNGAETSRVSGKLNVTSDIKASSDTLVDAYQGEEMEVIEFRYYALSANDVQLTWTNGTPTGITGDGVPNTNKFAISGTTSAKPGKYTYSITVNGSSTVITGYIEVISQNLGENPVLYLYQTKSPKRGYDNDGVFSYLKGKNVNLQPRTTINKLRSKEQYGKFKWILISDDVNADNAEVLEIARGGADLPVLNMKGFTYTEDRLGWGEPDNGSIDTISNNGQYIYVQQAKHPIFNGFNAQTNSKITIFDGLAQNGVMPINIDYPGSFALATAYTRNIEDYYKDGELQTIIHEIPAGERNHKKYICFPLSISSSNKLSSEGKKLLTNIVDYLISSEAASMTAPKLEMTAFKIGEYNGTIDQTNNTVDLVIDTDKYPDLDLKALKPIVSVADPMTHVSPASGAEVDFQYSLYMPVDYVVTDFINRRVYEVVVRAAASQGIEEVYSLGDWVNIYDVFGRKVATTNENIFTMKLPKGMYIIVTENGNTLKIMR